MTKCPNKMPFIKTILRRAAFIMMTFTRMAFIVMEKHAIVFTQRHFVLLIAVRMNVVAP